MNFRTKQAKLHIVCICMLGCVAWNYGQLIDKVKCCSEAAGGTSGLDI